MEAGLLVEVMLEDIKDVGEWLSPIKYSRSTTFDSFCKSRYCCGSWMGVGGHSLHVVCDMTLASKEHAFKQTDADVTSFAEVMVLLTWLRWSVKKGTRNLLFRTQLFCPEALEMGMVNAVIPHSGWSKPRINGLKYLPNRYLNEDAKIAMNLLMMGWWDNKYLLGNTRLAI